MILKINICGHSYCTDCVNSVFRTGEAECRIDSCGMRLKQAKFRTREFEDETMDKEMHFRRLVERVYNKQQDDFNSVFEYNNYVEDNENKIYDLTYGNSFRLKSLLKEIEEFQKGNLLIIRKNNEELNRKKKEWKQKVDKDQEYYQHIIKKHREEDQAKLSKNNVSKHDTELINKIAQQAQADVKNIVSSHQQQKEDEQKKKLEHLKKLQKEEESKNDGVVENDQHQQRRGNMRGILNRKKFDVEMETRKVEEPWEYKYSCNFLPKRKQGFPWIRTRDDVKKAGYDKLVNVSDCLNDWARLNVDVVSIAQRQVNDAMMDL